MLVKRGGVATRGQQHIVVRKNSPRMTRIKRMGYQNGWHWSACPPVRELCLTQRRRDAKKKGQRPGFMTAQGNALGRCEQFSIPKAPTGRLKTYDGGPCPLKCLTSHRAGDDGDHFEFAILTKRSQKFRIFRFCCLATIVGTNRERFVP